MNNLSILDFPGVIQKSFGSVKTFDIETAEYVIVENFEKGFLTEEIFLESMDLLEKGKRGSIGEIREWNGKKFMKTANGWKPVKGENAKRSEETVKLAKIADGILEHLKERQDSGEKLDMKYSTIMKMYNEGTETGKMSARNRIINMIGQTEQGMSAV